MAKSKQPNKPEKRKGRPTTEESNTLTLQLRNLWHEGCRNESIVAEQLHINRKTVHDHFVNWRIEFEKILEEQADSIIETEQIAKKEAEESIEFLQYDLVYHGNNIQNDLTEFRTTAKEKAEKGKGLQFRLFPSRIYDRLFEIMRLKMEVIDLKARIKLAPTTDKIMEKELAILMEKRGNVGLSRKGKNTQD